MSDTERSDRLWCAHGGFDNRVTRLLGVEVPIFQAPMGYVAKPPLVAAVSEAGAMGLIPGSLGTDVTREDIRRTRELTSKPFGVNLPLAFLRDADIVADDRRRGHRVRHHVGRLARQVRAGAQGRPG